MKRVLLCPPRYYDIEYEINPWMRVENKVDQRKVKEEFESLRASFEDLHVDILEIPQEKGLPDMVYSANFGNPFGNIFIRSNFMHSERKKEADFAAAYFADRGYEIQSLPEHIAFEGQGDLLTIGGRYFYGWGKRSHREARPFLEDILGAPVIDFKLVNPYYYHLDTCFAPLDENTVAINPISFEKEGREGIYNLFPHVIEVSTEDNHLIACNLVVVDKTIVIGRGISQKLKDDFAKYGYITREVTMDEYRKGGGSVKCLTLEFY